MKRGKRERERERERCGDRETTGERPFGRGSAFGWRLHLRKMASLGRSVGVYVAVAHTFCTHRCNDALVVPLWPRQHATSAPYVRHRATRRGYERPGAWTKRERERERERQEQGKGRDLTYKSSASRVAPQLRMHLSQTPRASRLAALPSCLCRNHCVYYASRSSSVYLVYFFFFFNIAVPLLFLHLLPSVSLSLSLSLCLFFYLGYSRDSCLYRSIIKSSERNIAAEARLTNIKI